ncbi:MAG: tRNA (N6-threonylcarbamoyladenosine(37)-N6)-methyltransferase TrmO [Dysgonamonadaceae bacterium]|nr:tRNA (N6-threonylcarbamoyladenosine(37)-N6)-methyltransferase TrmO [Dysgonamonadaceae bacterium]MDD3900661.1 tRNA (N6-threonylcarbamoyladenosine(37)-N6)-methyltransferase TrmO [Dysgonamonadaceae bacterium]MDD4397939.1 tRNA (N6-threonylcarbamoyladenosine(37)-N6)-methyltransferase TrmO [Dysgonamonadaceae bacterium]
MKIIAKIHTDFQTKFGVPRQSGLISSLQGKIIFEPEYRNVDAVRGLEGYEYIWLIWQFSEAIIENWSPTVRPPRLGGNKRVGVFATRSPFRPNPIGLSSVKLEKVEITVDNGPVLFVSGIDMMDGTPIYDIKPYIPLDCHQGAAGGFSDDMSEKELQVIFPDVLLKLIDEEKRKTLLKVLSKDPRPSYQEDPERIYGIAFAGKDVRFIVNGGILKVIEVI